MAWSLKKYPLFFLLLIFLSQTKFFYSQNQELDSLKIVLAKAKHDTNRLNILNYLVENSAEGIWEQYNEQLGTAAEELLDAKDEKVRRVALGYKAAYINNCGFIAFHLGDVQKALDSYHESLKIQSDLKNMSGVGLAYNNIGFTYSSQDNFSMALKYYRKAYNLYDSINNEEGRGLGLNNIGYVYDVRARRMIDEGSSSDSIIMFLKIALEKYQQSLAIHIKIKDAYGEGNCYNNIGAVYANLGAEYKKRGIEPDSAKFYSDIDILYHTKSLEIMQKLGDLRGVAVAQNNIGWHYYRKGDYSNAEKESSAAYKIATELGFPGTIRDAGKLLFNIYKAKGDYRLALKMHEVFISMRDSIQNEKNRKSGIQKHLQYEYDKKSAADSVRVAEEKKRINIELKQERTQKFALYGGLALVLLFSGFLFNRFRITNRQKKIIERQKEIVDEKQKEILDSITYAKRLQHAILPPKELIDDVLKQNFVLFKPKDIVAGDFYWMHQSGGIVLIAAADSTGHGVPGAMVSIVCSNALEKAAKEFKITDPGQLLDKATDLVLETFSKSGEEIKDGMDISVLCIDFNKKEVKWAGANNQLLYILPNATEIAVVKADKQPVGRSDNRKLFTTHTLEFIEGTIFYLITDGYADQFGGEKGKKYKIKNLEAKLISINGMQMTEQRKALDHEFADWKGNQEQVDDVTIIGVKL